MSRKGAEGSKEARNDDGDDLYHSGSTRSDIQIRESNDKTCATVSELTARNFLLTATYNLRARLVLKFSHYLIT